MWIVLLFSLFACRSEHTDTAGSDGVGSDGTGDTAPVSPEGWTCPGEPTGVDCMPAVSDETTWLLENCPEVECVSF